MQKTMSRRNFVKAAGVLGGAMLIGPGLFSSALAAPRANIQGLFSSYRLSNGVEIPLFGFEFCGDFASSSKQSGTEIAFEALKIGYKHIEVYKTEREVGEAFVLSQIPRQEVFLSLRLPQIIDNDTEFLMAFNESLAKMKVNYVDLLLVDLPQSHSRVSWLELAANVWRVAEQLYKEGRAKALGVVQLMPDNANDFLLDCSVKPMVNKVVLSPFIYNQRIVDVSYHHKMLVSSSIGEFSNEIFHNPILARIAKKHNKTVAQVVLRWGLQKSFVTIPCVSSVTQVKEYSGLFDFALDTRDMSSIARLKDTQR